MTPIVSVSPVAAVLPLRWTRDARIAMAALLACVALRMGTDLWIADGVARLEGGAFAWRHAPLLADIVHTGGRWLSITAWCVVTAAWAWLRVCGGHADLRQRLGLVSVAVLVSTTLIAAWKAGSGVDCPWDLARYGGMQACHRGFGAVAGHCFPAGHAGAGYAWMALGVAGRGLGPRIERAGWAIGLGAGVLFGVAQQLRGAHFASHDIAAALVCWAVARGVARVALPEPAR